MGLKFRILIYEFDQLGKLIHIIYNIIWSLTVDARAEFLNLCKYFWALRKFNDFLEMTTTTCTYSF